VIIPHYQSVPAPAARPAMMQVPPAQLPATAGPVISSVPSYTPAPSISSSPAYVPAQTNVYNPVTLEEQAKVEGDEEPTNKYFFMQILEGTRVGTFMDDNGISISGWTAMSYNTSTASKSNAPVFMIDQANAFQLNQNYLHFTKSIDTSKDEFQLGFTTDWILPGTDARTTLPRGLWNDQLTDLGPNGVPTLYPIDPFQFYVEAYLPNAATTVKVGRFATPIGYELVQQADTPFVSRSYLFQYNPFTHTGVYATTALGDNWSVGYGVVTGNDTFIDPANRATGLAQLRYAPKDGKLTAAVTASFTNPEFDVEENFAFYNCYNFLLTYAATDKLTYVLDTAYSHISNVPGIGGTNWYGAANYLIYKVTDNVAATVRGEVFYDTDGFRTGSEGLYTEVTAGVAWSPIKSLILRPSVRYDTNNQSSPFEGDSQLWTGAMEAIIRW